MKLTFYGGAQEVGRLSLLLEDNAEGKSRNLMLDCGIKLGTETEYPQIGDDELRRVNNIVISHAHLDHSGYLPHLYSSGHRSKIFMTKPTRDLLGVLLADYSRIHEGKVTKTGRGHRRLFSEKDVAGVMESAKIVEYQEHFDADFKCSFHNAGHILGSAMTMIEHPLEDRRIIFTGDICMRKTRVLDPCVKHLKADTLIMESTYGGRDDLLPSYKESYHRMMTIINETLNQGGHVLIPSFAVGRAQEVLLALDDYMRSGAMRPTKIYVEGMINKAMKIYRHNAYYANEDIKKRILMSEDDPFKSPNFHVSRSKTREDVLKEPCIIVTTSGMLTGGPVQFYLERLGENPANTLIFVGYQAEGTPGSKVVAGERKLMIGEKEIELRMRVENIRLSGHADFNELLQFAKSIKGLKKIFLMHGEKTDLVEYLDGEYEVAIPKTLETHDV